MVETDNTNPSRNWGFNGDVDKPVFTPSVLCRTYRYPHPFEPDTNPEHAEIREKFEKSREAGDTSGHDWMMNHPKWGRRCHVFVGCNGAQPGEIIFLDDCTHGVKGVRPLAPLPPRHQDKEEPNGTGDERHDA